MRYTIAFGLNKCLLHFKHCLLLHCCLSNVGWCMQFFLIKKWLLCYCEVNYPPNADFFLLLGFGTLVSCHRWKRKIVASFTFYALIKSINAIAQFYETLSFHIFIFMWIDKTSNYSIPSYIISSPHVFTNFFHKIIYLFWFSKLRKKRLPGPIIKEKIGDFIGEIKVRSEPALINF